jgi:Rho-binding antiterminator
MISCDRHDYIEIACLYHLPVKLVFKHAESITGIAQDTVYNDEKEECMSLLLDSGETRILRLCELKTMQAMQKNPHFDQVSFD